MATVQAFLYPDTSTLANFKAWAQMISNALSTFGWKQTADSGQVVWSSVASAGAFVYEIWKSGDALTSANPIYLKVEYGAQNTGTPGLAFTVGSGSDGAGNLTNAGTRNNISNGSGSNTTQLFECSVSGDTARFQLVFFRGFETGSIFSVERSHDTSGNDTASYVTTLASGFALGGPFCFQQTIFPQANGGPLTHEPFGLTFQTSNPSTLLGTIAPVPFWPLVGKIDSPLLGAVLLKSGDVPDGLVFTVNLYGAAHTYIVAKSNSAAVVWANNQANAIAMRFE